MSCCVGCRCGSDLALLWLWCRLAATALMGLLAWEPPYAAGTAVEKRQRQKIKKKKEVHFKSLNTNMKSKAPRRHVYTVYCRIGFMFSCRFYSLRGFLVSHHRPCPKSGWSHFPWNCCSFYSVLLSSPVLVLLFLLRCYSVSPLSTKIK